MWESFFIMDGNKRKSLEGSLLWSGLYLLTSYNEKNKKEESKREKMNLKKERDG